MFSTFLFYFKFSCIFVMLYSFSLLLCYTFIKLESFNGVMK